MRENESQSNSKEGTPTISLSELLKGNVRVVFATLWVAPCGQPDIGPGPCYTTPEERQQAMDQLNYYRKLAEGKYVTLITTRKELELVVSSKEPKLGLVILMEGADTSRTPVEIHEWFKTGVRTIGPAWGKTRYSGGSGSPGPLTEDGRKLMVEMEKAGLILDTSHLAEESFYEALDIFHGTVIASHSNSRIYVPTDRQLSDDMIRTIVSRGGVIGTVLYNKFLDPDWAGRGEKKSDVTFASVVKHIKHVCDVAGDSLHVGIGSDLDGGFGVESAPAELETVADLERIGNALSEAKFSETEIENILGGNWLRILRNALPD